LKQAELDRLDAEYQAFSIHYRIEVIETYWKFLPMRINHTFSIHYRIEVIETEFPPLL